MAMNIGNTTTSELDQKLKIQITDAQTLDTAGEQKETYWQTSNWENHLGYYKSHVAVKSVINKLGMWTVGKGVKTTKASTKKTIEKIKGWGKDTFNEVIDNQIRIKHINGDSYAEIIKDKSGKLINLKPLNPGRMRHIVNPLGMLIRYEQMNSKGDKAIQKFEVDEIFHLSLNRTADEIHGTGDIESIITFLDKIKQVDEDMAVLFHRFVVPLVIWRLNTDDEEKMATFKSQSKNARNGGEDMVIPEMAVSYELLEAGKGIGNVFNPMDWRNKWAEEVIKGGGVPALIMAIEAGTTEASSKMVYLAWQQVIEKEQRDLEAQIKLQLNLEVEFEFPARIEENLGEDEGKDGDINKTIKSDVETKQTQTKQSTTKPPK